MKMVHVEVHRKSLVALNNRKEFEELLIVERTLNTLLVLEQVVEIFFKILIHF
jgi:hypothetical protein